MSAVCKADVFCGEAGKRTEARVRFSNAGGERGISELDRDLRGFACKFYTPEGNWDLVANNAPVFFIRDAMLFPELAHAIKRDPRSDLKDADAFWAFMAAVPESIHALLFLFGDRGTPASYRHMNGYGVHTFVLVNAAGARTLVKFHLKAVEGVKSLTSAAAAAVQAGDTNALKRDLHSFLAAGGEAAYTVFWQLIPEADAARLPYDVFDATRVVPHGDYPLTEVGRLVLTAPVDNFFAEVEEAAFAPGNLVPGIEAAAQDRMLHGRIMAYPDAARYRLGANFRALPVNRPLQLLHQQQAPGRPALSCPFAGAVAAAAAPTPHLRDGLMSMCPAVAAMASGGNATAAAVPDGDLAFAESKGSPVSGVPGRYELQWAAGAPGSAPNPNAAHEGQAAAEDDGAADYVQAQRLYRHVMGAEERARLAANVAAHLRRAGHAVRTRALRLFYRVDRELGDSVGALMRRSWEQDAEAEEEKGAASSSSSSLAVNKEPGGAVIALVERELRPGNAIVEHAVQQADTRTTPAPQPSGGHASPQRLPLGAAAAVAMQKNNAIATGARTTARNALLAAVVPDPASACQC